LNGRVSALHVTLLIEDLARLAAAVAPDTRLPALERAWSRGTPLRLAAQTANHLRFALFGIAAEGPLPVAALTHVDDRSARPDGDFYWLRVDPVTVWADMARVFMTRYGFADLDPYERNEIENCVRSVLQEEGMVLRGDHPERWCIPLGKPLRFGFTPLDEALGMDLADALPDHPEAAYWRRVLNEIQVALHNAPVNERRRAAGKREVNSVWFWGGGFIPDAAPHYVLDTVYSDDAVTRGLAIINDCRLKRLEECLSTELSRDGQAVLIDWTAGGGDAGEELLGVEGLAGRLLRLAERGQLTLILYDGSGQGRSYGRLARHRFWRRSSPLALAGKSGALPGKTRE
jgi:hypothetical protein